MSAQEQFMQEFIADLADFFATPNIFRSVLLLVVSMLFAFWLSNLLAKAIVKFAQTIARKSDTESNQDRALQLRQIETLLSVAIAIIRATVVLVVGFSVWQIISPAANASLAAISISTVFLVIASQTAGPLLRDITAGSAMIIEKWFNVGDFIKVEPFMDVSGVVERFTLRSTKIRSLNGEVVWIHNQQIGGVHVSPRGLRTIAVDVFMRDRTKGEAALKTIIATMPQGKLMLAKPLRITEAEELGPELVRFTIVGQTPPEREWLIENVFVQALKELDDEDTPRRKKLLVLDPIQRYADPIAEKRFNRAVRIARDKNP